MKIRHGMCLKSVAGMFVAFLLLALLPITASAVEYTSLATIKRGLTYPTDVAIAQDGKVFVVDGISRKVLTYDSTYRYLGSFTSVKNPVAVATSPSGKLYVADNLSKSVKILNPASGAVTGFLTDASGAMATFELPRNIAVGPDSTVYVVDQFGDSIEVFNGSGVKIDTIGGLIMPQDVIASATDLYIIDQPRISETNTGGTSGSGTINGSRIQIYELVSRTFTSGSFPSFGNDTDVGEFISLKGIGIDPQNNIYLSDSFLQVVYKYDADGVFLGPLNDAFATPLGMTVSADGRLLATSSYDGIVKVLGVDEIGGADTWMNDAPLADAGANQTVDEGADFALDGSGSSDVDGIASYRWTQTGGTLILPENPFVADSAQVTLTAPNVGPAGALLSFDLVVTDSKTKLSASSSTKVIVTNIISGSVVINDGALYANDLLVSLSLDSFEATEMRFSNGNDSFTGAYYPYTISGNWTLSDGDGAKVVNVEFKDAGGNTAIASSSIVLDTEDPAAPQPVDLGGGDGYFDWQPVDDAVSYTFQYASNSDFTGADTFAGLTFNGLTMVLDGLASGTWYWRVQAVDAAGNVGGWSEFGTFRVGPNCDAIPDTPKLALPFDKTEDVSRTAMLETGTMVYAAECGEHLRTEWQISKKQDFKALVMHVGTTQDNLTAYQAPALVLESQTSYYWRVRQVATNGQQSDWSAAWTFTTEAAYDTTGEDGVLYVEPEGDSGDGSGEEITIKAAIGDAKVKIKAIRVSAGVVTKTIQALDPDSIPDTVNKPATFPLGLLSFRLAVAEPGAYVQVKVLFRRAVPADAEWYSYDAESGWHVYEGAVFSRNMKSVVLNFQDGGIGDSDGVANGIIVNP